MKDIPILFSAPMVRATLVGTKTQTRRPVKITLRTPGLAACLEPRAAAARPVVAAELCPYGQPGGRLWGRETFFAFGRWETRFSARKGRDEWHFVDMTREAGETYGYAADGGGLWPMPGRRQQAGATPGWWKRPAIFMPRAASRISLEVTGVRVERLQGISYDDAVAEGITDPVRLPQFPDQLARSETVEEYARRTRWPQRSYRTLWEQINGPGSWDANPWVWVIEFRRM